MRSYGQFCGLARALDVVGDRWNLLIVRQLLLAPARYRELLHGLPGMATNLLASRLRDLESAGVIERRPAPHATAVEYSLTDWGAQLREPIESLIRWSEPLIAQGRGTHGFQVEWFMVTLQALLHPRWQGAQSLRVGIHVEDRIVEVRASWSALDVLHHSGDDLQAVLHTNPHVALGLAAGSLHFDDTRALVRVDGDEAAIRAVFAA